MTGEWIEKQVWLGCLRWRGGGGRSSTLHCSFISGMFYNNTRLRWQQSKTYKTLCLMAALTSIFPRQDRPQVSGPSQPRWWRIKHLTRRSKVSIESEKSLRSYLWAPSLPANLNSAGVHSLLPQRNKETHQVRKVPKVEYSGPNNTWPSSFPGVETVTWNTAQESKASYSLWREFILCPSRLTWQSTRHGGASAAALAWQN